MTEKSENKFWSQTRASKRKNGEKLVSGTNVDSATNVLY